MNTTDAAHSSNCFAYLVTDVGRGTSGTSRDVPIFVQFHKKIRTVHDTKREKKVAKKRQIWRKMLLLCPKKVLMMMMKMKAAKLGWAGPGAG